MISLLALILFASCEEPNEIGEDLIRDKDKVGVFLKELPITSHQILKDSLITISDRFLSGTYNDPEFGNVYSESYVNITPATTAKLDIAEDAIMDSLVLFLGTEYFYGPEGGFTNPNTINIYRLTDSLTNIGIDTTTQDSTFFTVPYSNETRDFNPVSLGSRTFTVTEDLIEEDSVLSIHLSEEFGKEILSRAISQDSFLLKYKELIGFMKGLAIVPDENNSVILGFNTSSPDTRMKLYYHSQQDTSVLSFDFDGRLFTHIASDRSGTPLAGLDENDQAFVPDNNDIYIQNGTGVIPVIEFNEFKDFADSVGRFIINSATLELRLKDHPANLVPPPSIYVYVSDSTQEIKTITSRNLTSAVTLNNGSVTQSSQILRLNIQEDKKVYYIDVSLLLQDFMNNDPVFDRLILAPGANFYPYTNHLITSQVNRAIFDLSETKLKVYYTTIR